MLRAECQSVLMSKVTNDGLTRSDTGCFSCTHGNSGRQRVKRATLVCSKLLQCESEQFILYDLFTRLQTIDDNNL